MHAFVSRVHRLNALIGTREKVNHVFEPAMISLEIAALILGDMRRLFWKGKFQAVCVCDTMLHFVKLRSDNCRL